jgi:hypothetical protein
MIPKFKLIIAIFFIQFLFSQQVSAATVNALAKRCGISLFCDALATAGPQDSAEDIGAINSCFQKKINACFHATTRGGVWWRANKKDLSQTILYGNFCGWRNLAKNGQGGSLDWKNESEVLKATQLMPAIDAFDELCKWHDIQYFTPPYSICEADEIFIQKIQELIWDPKTNLSKETREVALAIAGAIQRNWKTCGVIGKMKRLKFWN